MNWDTPVREVFARLGVRPPKAASLVRGGDIVGALGTSTKPGRAAVVMMPRSEYDALVRAADDTADRASVRRAKAGTGHYLPGEVVLRMLSGENRLRVLREHRGLTLDGLAARAAVEGVTVGKAALSHIETGRNKPSVELLGALAKALDVTLDDLAG